MLQKPGADVALQFFQLTIGTLSEHSETIANRVFATFLAISSLGMCRHSWRRTRFLMLKRINTGNIIVMTYTAARGKLNIYADRPQSR